MPLYDVWLCESLRNSPVHGSKPSQSKIHTHNKNNACLLIQENTVTLNTTLINGMFTKSMHAYTKKILDSLYPDFQLIKIDLPLRGPGCNGKTREKGGEKDLVHSLVSKGKGWYQLELWWSIKGRGRFLCGNRDIRALRTCIREGEKGKRARSVLWLTDRELTRFATTLREKKNPFLLRDLNGAVPCLASNCPARLEESCGLILVSS